MPSLIFSQGTLTTKNSVEKSESDKQTTENSYETPEQTAINNFVHYAARQEAARRWMWLGVISFAIMIIILWGWSFYLKTTSLHWKSSPNNSLIGNAKKDWGAIFEQNKNEQLRMEANQRALTQTIQEAVNNQLNASSSILTTSSTVTSTPKY